MKSSKFGHVEYKVGANGAVEVVTTKHTTIDPIIDTSTVEIYERDGEVHVVSDSYEGHARFKVDAIPVVIQTLKCIQRRKGKKEEKGE